MGTEVWRSIKGYEGIYEVSNMGNVRSLPRKAKGRKGIVQGVVLKPALSKDGYLRVTLSKDNICINKSVHRLVGEAFLDNPYGYPVINHKDENKTNNSVDNLEFCTIQYNSTYRNGNQRNHEHMKKPIIAIKDDEVIRFESIQDAARKLGVAHGNICSCLRGRYGYKTIKGYRFEYE